MFTTPPTALLPYSRVAGPLTISIRSRWAESTGSACSPDWAESVPVGSPSQHEDAVAVESPDYRAGTAGPETAFVHSRFGRHDVAQAEGALFAQLERTDRRDGLKRVKGAHFPPGGRDRDLVFHRDHR